MFFLILRSHLAFLLPPELIRLISIYLQHPLVDVFNSEWVTCTLHHKQGGCLNCFAEGPDLCRSNNIPFVTVRLTQIFDIASDLHISPIRVFRCYQYVRRRLRWKSSYTYANIERYNRVLDELLEHHRLRRTG